jgi:mannitol-1-/sugar-/sorbitol-6-phosphatase
MTTRIACCAVLFDLDGVLIDSTPAVTRVWAKWAARHGFDVDEVVRKAHGRPSLSTIKEYLPNADHEAENRIVERAEIEDLEGVVPLPGALELLQGLPANSWAIVTSCTRPLARVRIGAAGLPVPRYLVTADDIVRGKPDPEPYLKGAALVGCSPRDCIVIEDVPAGIHAGKAAGARVIAVRTTAKDDELREADWILQGCDAITVGHPGGEGQQSLLLDGI